MANTESNFILATTHTLKLLFLNHPGKHSVSSAAK